MLFLNYILENNIVHQLLHAGSAEKSNGSESGLPKINGFDRLRNSGCQSTKTGLNVWENGEAGNCRAHAVRCAMYLVTQKLPQICTANHTTFPIRKCKITVTSGSPINLHTMLNKNLVYIKEILFLCNIEDFFFNLSVFLSL